MGRKAKFENGAIVKRGPGKKTKKQGDPVLPKALKGISMNRHHGTVFLLFYFQMISTMGRS